MYISDVYHLLKMYCVTQKFSSGVTFTLTASLFLVSFQSYGLLVLGLSTFNNSLWFCLLPSWQPTTYPVNFSQKKQSYFCRSKLVIISSFRQFNMVIFFPLLFFASFPI